MPLTPRARPKKPLVRRIRLPEEEHRAITAAAKKLGFTMVEVLRAGGMLIAIEAGVVGDETPSPLRDLMMKMKEGV